MPITYRHQHDRNVADLSTQVDGAPRPLMAFKAGYVFDVSQTDGEPLAGLPEIGGDPGAFAARLRAFAESRRIGIAYANHELGSAYGASLGRRILLGDDLSPAVEFSVLVEIAHELLHRGDRRAATSKTVRETEAEAVAFVVSDAIGLDTSTAATDYVGAALMWRHADCDGDVGGYSRWGVT